ncbi:MAG: SDR family oxidoreductase [Gammaproteobacteria bacterium]|nr:SDR family oxidoreductase [Gammaproteobacteria bacterium]
MVEFPDESGLDGKVAMVIGGGARGDGIGNGRAAALLMAREGARVVVVDRTLRLAERTVEMITAAGGMGLAVEADVTESNQCESLVASTMSTYGRLDVLVNNVGIGSRGSVVDEDESTWERVMRVNVTTMFLVSKFAIPAIAKSGGGSIVNISSISALRPRGLTAYSTSKGAVIALTKAMAVDHGPQQIRVNCVAPGPVYTPMVVGDGMDDEARDQRRKASVLGIEGTGWDIGNAVTFLASERARYITGQVIVVDGGATARGPERGH